MRGLKTVFLLILSMIGISVNAAEKISGSVMLTGGRTTIDSNSDDYSFNDFHLTGNIILNDSYFASLTHSNQKHSSTGKNHKHKFYWTKVGYQIPLSNILEVNSLDTMKVFASIGYFTSKWLYAGQFPDNTGSGSSYSIGARFAPLDQVELILEVSPLRYNSGSLNGKHQRITELTATYFLSDKVGLNVAYHKNDSRWVGGLGGTSWSTGIELRF
tara:strand:+ start:233 stop:877 length:645 start_codon:yes stop_codon:yes gene_type:complete